MPRRFLPWIFWLLLPVSSVAGPSKAAIHHDLDIRIDPGQSAIQVEDRISLAENKTSFSFLLHGDLQPRSLTTGATLHAGPAYAGAVPVREWQVRFTAPSDQFRLEYSGRIHHPLATLSQNYVGGRSTTPGSISEAGIFLSGGSYWYPVIPNALLSFSMRTDLPEGWTAISQGEALEDRAGWQEQAPQDEVYLIGAPYHHYQRDVGVALAEVYLRSADAATAERYLQATAQYLQRYSRLIGPYPYAKFALVENFWESGYGMPSFTLLGPGVIRLPFILHSSYPHEILHNWWGNGVYIDYSGGNWSEGLTAYLADHLNKELIGQGANYRRDTLQKYADYVAGKKDFPLTEFRGNHGAVSQAVGYGKTLMFMHMLRQRMGDPHFLEGLRIFYRDNLFRAAGFRDLQRAFEASSGEDLDQQFLQWTAGTGAPELGLDRVELETLETGYRLKARLRQLQPGPAFSLQVPLFIQLQGHATALHQNLEMTGKELLIDINLQQQPLQLAVDPRFDLFRRLHPSEIPAALGQLFGADRLSIVLPGKAPADLRTQYQWLADSWSERQPGIDVVWDTDLQRLPEDGPVWIFGSENRFLEYVSRQLDASGARLSDNGLSVDDQSYPVSRYSFALAATDGEANGRTLGLLTLNSPDSMPALARKLPHYSKYSYLVFQGSQAKNSLKGQWQTDASTLTVELGTAAATTPLQLPQRAPLITPHS